MYTLATSHVIVIDSHYTYLYGVTPRKGTSVIQTWHAVGLFKKFALDMPTMADSKLRKEQIRQHKSYTAVLCSAESLREDYARAFGVSIDKVHALGTIKTDVLHVAKQNQAQHKQHFYKQFPQAEGKKIVLYAPTFRNSQLNLLKEKPETAFTPAMNGQEFVKLFSQEYFLAFRAHYCHQSAYALDASYANVTKLPLAGLLAATDILITDYSSIFFDFLLFQRPIIFFPYDMDTYLDSRGCYFPYKEFVPGPVCLSQEAVFDVLRQTHEKTPWDQAFWDTFMASCDGNVSKKILQFIKNIPS